MSEDRILQALTALARQDRELQAPAEIEERVLLRFRERRALRRRRWIAVGALAASIAGGTLWLQKPRTLVKPSPVSPQPVAEIPPEERVLLPTLPPMKVRRPEPKETVTEFFPWTDVAPPFERGQLLRVELPASAMRSVGLSVQEEHLGDFVQAEVLVGEEGLPRAIRFVKSDMQ